VDLPVVPAHADICRGELLELGVDAVKADAAEFENRKTG